VKALEREPGKCEHGCLCQGLNPGETMRPIAVPFLLMTALPLAMLTAAARGDGPPGEKELKSPIFWLRAAAGDSGAGSFKDRAEFLVRDYEDQVRAGDPHGIDLLLDGARAAKVDRDQAAFALHAASLLIDAGKYGQALPLLTTVEQLASQCLPDPNSVMINYDSRGEWMVREVAVQHVRLGDLAQARKHVLALLSMDDRCAGSIEIAGALFAMRQPDPARDVLAQARAEVHKDKHPELSDVWVDMAFMLNRAGRFDEALDCAKEETDSYRHPQIVEWVVIAQARAGKIDASRATAAKYWTEIDALPVEKRLHEYVGLATEQAFEAGDPAGAVQTLQRAELVVKALAGQPGDAALDFAAEGAPIHILAGDLAAASREQKAVDAADAARPPGVERPLLFGFNEDSLLRAQAKAGKFDLALSLRKKDSDYQLRNIIEEMAKAGQFTRASQLLDQVQNEESRAHACSAVTKEWAAKGDVAGLYRWVNSLTTAQVRAWAELGAGEGLIPAAPAYEFVTSPPGPIIGLGGGIDIGG
jgi:tetratricopeptide (TPR) repeat protein